MPNYPGRYTHKIAISNQRIKGIDEHKVTFDYKDYRQQGSKKQMTFSHEEFVRKFALHILPRRFVKIRHYGILSSTWKRQKLKKLQTKLGIIKGREVQVEKKKVLPRCPCCKSGNMITLLTFDKRGPPAIYLGSGKKQYSCED